MRRATSAAVLVEQKASQLGAKTSDDSETSSDKSQVVETVAARWEKDNVYLIGNPLKTTSEILCPKCGKQRLLYPTEGVGARAPEPGIGYCKIRPFIEKEECDVYGQVYQAPGPGRGHKKEKAVKLGKEGTPNGSQDSPGGSPPPEARVAQVQFPHAKCLSCEKFFPIKRMNNHMAKCIGGTGRESSRSALTKIQNGNGNGNGSGYNSSGSRNTTPAPSASSANRKSPTKRTASDDFDSEETSATKKKKFGPKKLQNPQLKSAKMKKSASQMSASNLSFEQRLSDDEYDDGDDARDGTFGKKESKGTIKVDSSGGKLKIKMGKKATAPLPTKTKTKWLYKDNGVEIPAPILPEKTLNGINKEALSDESSQTMSSPNGE